MIADDLINNREAESRAAGGRRREGFEQSLDLFGRHPRPRVREGDADAPVTRRVEFDAQPPAFGHGRERVAREIPEDLTQARRIGLRADGRVREILFDDVAVARLGAVAQERESFA